MRGRRVFRLDGEEGGPALAHLNQRLALRQRFSEACLRTDAAEERRTLARLLREHDAERLDAGESCDCSDPSCSSCELRLDSIVGVSRIPAARWIGAAKVRELEQHDAAPNVRAGADRRIMVAAVSAATPERAAWAEAASLDQLRAAYEALEEPPEEEKTDMRSTTISPVILARAQRIIRSEYGWRSDAAEPTRGELEQLRDLIALSKAEGIALKELLDALQELKDISTGSATKTDARDAGESPVDRARRERAERQATRHQRPGWGGPGGEAA
jgi:hypothetical protein